MNITLDDYVLPLAQPLRTATDTIGHRRGFIVTAEGAKAGYGDAAPLPGWTESRRSCRAALETASDLIQTHGRDAALSHLEETPAARHGLSLALLDHDARVAGQALYRFLGGSDHVESLPVNATIGNEPVVDATAAIRNALAQDYRTIKLKVGNRPIDEEIARITAAIDLLPTDVLLRLDANGAWSLSTAKTIIATLTPTDISYIEQPLPPDHAPADYASIPQTTSIAVDEALLHHPPTALITQHGIDILVLKPMVLGGVDRALDIATTARSRGIEPVVTTTFDSVIARTAAVHLAATIEPNYACGLATAHRLTHDLGPDPTHVTAGTITVPQTPGHGALPRVLT